MSTQKRKKSAVGNGVAKVQAAPKELSDEDAALVRSWARRSLEGRKRQPPRFAAVPDRKLGKTIVSPDPAVKRELFWARASEVGGSNLDEANIALVSELGGIALSHGSAESALQPYHSLLAHVLNVAPRDGIEGMLATQLVSTHHQAMRLLTSAANTKHLDQGNFFYNQSARLMRLFTLQLDALAKYRGKSPSEQRVTVQHVHVHDGGQAVVGPVSQQHTVTGEGGGTSVNA